MKKISSASIVHEDRDQEYSSNILFNSVCSKIAHGIPVCPTQFARCPNCQSMLVIYDIKAIQKLIDEEQELYRRWANTPGH